MNQELLKKIAGELLSLSDAELREKLEELEGSDLRKILENFTLLSEIKNEK